MRHTYCLLAILVFVAIPSVFAQKMSFQSNFYQNGVPASGQHTIQFFIGPPINWASPIHTVNVVKGYYNTIIDLPPGIFDDANPTREMIVILDNIYRDTMTILPPYERDPFVKGYIQDSIQWLHVHNKPTIDTSYTNELQQLSLSGDTLKISKGNNVLLPYGMVNRTLVVNGNLKVIDTTLKQFISVPNTGTITPYVGSGSYWQSFRPKANGKLRTISLTVGVSSGSVIVEIYKGEGITAQSLGFKTISIGTSVTLDTLDLSSGINSSSNGYISLLSGDVYTFKLTPFSGFITIAANASNPYPDGISSISSTTDIPFNLSIDNSAPPRMTFGNNGSVGFGVDSPTAQLHVQGRIKDKSGFVMPVGTVISYAGANIPEGWLLCDGTAVSRTNYAELYEALGSAWGNGDGTTTFTLPDLRGQFLRGVDNSPTKGSSNNDPERNIRVTSNTGGNTGNAVGSKQDEQLKSHSHPHPYMVASYVFPYGNLKVTGGSDFNFQYVNAATGGTETRPKNAYVQFIIKY